MSTEHAHTSNVPFGLWVYLMSDCILFASLFAGYAVLHTATAGGPTPNELFDAKLVLAETIILLTSSFVSGIAVWASTTGRVRTTWAALTGTFVLGATFLALEWWEFSKLVAEGAGWQTSAFLSSYFALVGTHGAHVCAGLVWLSIVALHLLLRGLSRKTKGAILCFALFWHFLDLIWIGIFSFVYLFGMISL